MVVVLQSLFVSRELIERIAAVVTVDELIRLQLDRFVVMYLRSRRDRDRSECVTSGRGLRLQEPLRIVRGYKRHFRDRCGGRSQRGRVRSPSRSRQVLEKRE